MTQQLPIQEFTRKFANLWNLSPLAVPEMELAYNANDKKEREKYFEEFINSINKRSNRKEIKPGAETKLTPLAHSLFKRVFGYSDAQLNIILSEGYKNATKDFIKMSREFDPGIELDDIFQACRNAWIMNGIQLMFGEKIGLTPSIFAYSMLYPYSDNYIDDPDVSKEVKKDFSKRFRAKLCGKKVQPVNKNEELIMKLVEMIETEWSREKYPKVFASLLAIHDAQLKSLSLIGPGGSLTGEEVLGICIEKGGTSVLADAYLIAGKLEKKHEEYFFGFGAYLQLLDDIQDVNEDSNAGLQTVFSQAVTSRGLDGLSSKTFHFGGEVFKLVDSFNGRQIPVFKSLVKKSVEIMMLETILLSRQYYSPGYIREIESYSPLSIEYLEKRRSKLSPQRISFMKKIIESAIAGL